MKPSKCSKCSALYSGRQGYCPPCKAQYMRGYNRQYYLNNREEILAFKKLKEAIKETS